MKKQSTIDMFQHKWSIDSMEKAVGEAQRTPIFKAIRWKRAPLVQVLLDHGADIHALASNPFSPGDRGWSALHVFAHKEHDRDLDLMLRLVSLGFAPEGPASSRMPITLGRQQIRVNLVYEIDSMTIQNDGSQDADVESPFTVALRHNAFNLKDELLSLGADPQYICLQVEDVCFRLGHPWLYHPIKRTLFAHPP
ncbi:MAG: hypothetical protein Q9191_002785 [Dirinaria sp. TL-2023a]